MKNISLLSLLLILSIATANAQELKYVMTEPNSIEKYYDLDSTAIKELKKSDTIFLIGLNYPYWKVRIGHVIGYIHELYIAETPEVKKFRANFYPWKGGFNQDKPTIVNPLKDVYPEFIYGPDGWRKYLAENLKIPKELAAGEAVKVWVKFVVEKNGRITHINVPERADDEYTKEAVRLIKKSPKWCPGFKNGVPSTYDFSVFIVFYRVKNS